MRITELWEKYDYRDYGIIGEPYFDIDFDEVFKTSTDAIIGIIETEVAAVKLSEDADTEATATKIEYGECDERQRRKR